MPVKINFPKQNFVNKQKLMVIQGRCDDAAQVTGVLKNGAGQVVAGQKLPVRNPRHWGYRYKLAKDSYHFTLTQAATATLASASPGVAFRVDPAPPPPPHTPPVVTAPADGDEVANIFYPFGTSNAQQSITGITFTGNGQNVAGTVTQQTDPDGNWEGEVDVSACPSAGGYTLNVSNDAGTTPVNNLTIP